MEQKIIIGHTVTIGNILDKIVDIEQVYDDLSKMRKSYPANSGESEVIRRAMAHLNCFKALIQSIEVSVPIRL